MRGKEGIFIEEHEGYKIYYAHGRFKAIKDKISLEAETERELRELIKEQEKDLRRFKPVDVIKVLEGIQGRITSRVADDERAIYFNFKRDGQPVHKKERIDYGGWARDSLPVFVEATPENLNRLADIKKLEESIKKTEDAIEFLKKQFEKPVTWETMEKAAGEEEE